MPTAAIPRPMPIRALSALAVIALGATLVACDGAPDEPEPPTTARTTASAVSTAGVENAADATTNVAYLATGDRISVPDGLEVGFWNLSLRTVSDAGVSLVFAPVQYYLPKLACTTAASCASDHASQMGLPHTERSVGDTTYHAVGDETDLPIWFLDRKGTVLVISGQVQVHLGGDRAVLDRLVASIDWTGETGTPVWFPDGTRIGVGPSPAWALDSSRFSLERPGSGSTVPISLELADTWCSSAATCQRSDPTANTADTTETRTVKGVTYHVGTWAGYGSYAPREYWYCERNGHIYSIRGLASEVPAFMEGTTWGSWSQDDGGTLVDVAVMHWNVGAAYGHKGNDDIAEKVIADQIVRWNDAHPGKVLVATFNEMCYSQHERVMAQLEKDTGQRYWAHWVTEQSRYSHCKTGPQWMGNVIYSNQPMGRGTTQKITDPSDPGDLDRSKARAWELEFDDYGRGAEHRYLLCTKFTNIPGLEACTTHVTHPDDSEKVRRQQLAQIRSIVNTHVDRTFVLTGDLNEDFFSPAFKTWYTGHKPNSYMAELDNAHGYDPDDLAHSKLVGYPGEKKCKGEAAAEHPKEGYPKRITCTQGSRKIDFVFVRASRLATTLPEPSSALVLDEATLQVERLKCNGEANTDGSRYTTKLKYRPPNKEEGIESGFVADDAKGGGGDACSDHRQLKGAVTLKIT